MEKNQRIIEDYILQNSDKLYRLAFSFTRNKDDALDIVQETILKALKSSQSLKEPKYIKTWCYNILTNTAIDFIRKNKKYVFTDNILILENKGVCDTYEDIDLKNALDLLSYEQRIVITLRFFEDFKLQEIADILDENINTIKGRLYKALKILKIKITSQEAQ